jgi:hypothetical protein
MGVSMQSSHREPSSSTLFESIVTPVAVEIAYGALGPHGGGCVALGVAVRVGGTLVLDGTLVAVPAAPVLVRVAEGTPPDVAVRIAVAVPTGAVPHAPRV